MDHSYLMYRFITAGIVQLLLMQMDEVGEEEVL
jgi:hypothetical protein